MFSPITGQFMDFNNREHVLECPLTGVTRSYSCARSIFLLCLALHVSKLMSKWLQLRWPAMPFVNLPLCCAVINGFAVKRDSKWEVRPFPSPALAFFVLSLPPACKPMFSIWHAAPWPAASCLLCSPCAVCWARSGCGRSISWTLW